MKAPNHFGLLVVALASILGAHAALAQGIAPAIPTAAAVPASPLSHLDLDNYKLLPGDSISILVYQEDDMTTQARLTKDGSVTVPLIGQIKISGLTCTEAANKIRDDLISKQFLISPRVTVVLSAASERSFVILGQISRPGTYAFSSQDSVTLVQAIAMAGGFTRIANQKVVTVVRDQDGVKQTFKQINVKKMIQDSNAPPFEIKTGDIITVGETFF